MSTYRQRLQAALLRTARPKATHYQRFYEICEAVGCVAFLAAWLAAIIAHL